MTKHDTENDIHLKSIAYIPDMLKKAIFIIEEVNEKTHTGFESYRYYVCGLNIGGVDYTAKIVVGVKHGETFYDHALTDIEKSSLIKSIDSINTEFANKETTLSTVKDKRLIFILQTNASKVVDENGEPKVMYHQTNSTQYVNRETGQIWDDLDWKERDEWENVSQEEWEDTWEEQDFYTFDNSKGRQSVKMPAFFFSPEYDEYHEYGDRTIAAFLNIRKPAINPKIKDAGFTNTAGLDAMNSLIDEGYDGFINTWLQIGF